MWPRVKLIPTLEALANSGPLERRRHAGKFRKLQPVMLLEQIQDQTFLAWWASSPEPVPARQIRPPGATTMADHNGATTTAVQARCD